MSSLDGKCCAITGATSGIGLATARLFVAEGADVALLARDPERVATVADDLGARAIGVAGDVMSLPDLQRLMSVASDRFGRVDVVMANAGIGRFAPIEETTPEMFDELCGVHFKAAFFTVQAALPYLDKGASIILVSAAGASRGFPLTSVYNAAKAAVRSLARTMAAELAPRGIRVNTISPGLSDTPMAQGDIGIPPEIRDQAAAKQIEAVPMGRLGRPEEIAAAARFLASDEASFFTGAELCPDGGLQQV